MASASARRILHIDDDPALADIVFQTLALDGHQLRWAKTAAAGLAEAVAWRPDMIILDLGLPDARGLDVCVKLKSDRRTRAIPVLILTGDTTTKAQLEALSRSADHFLAKPLTDLGLFRDWVRALLSRPPTSQRTPDVLRLGSGLELDTEALSVRLGHGTPVSLPPKLFELVAEFAARPGEVLSRQFLVDRVWSGAVRDREVDVALSRLRAALGPEFARALNSVPGRGYRLDITAFSL